MFDKLFGRSNAAGVISFDERRHRSRSAEPGRKNRDSDIFNRRTGRQMDDSFASEYRKSFAWNASDGIDSIVNRGDRSERQSRTVDPELRPATALSFMNDESGEGSNRVVSRSITMDQITVSMPPPPHAPVDSVDSQLVAVRDRLSNDAKSKYHSIFGKKAGSNVLFQTEPTVTAVQLTKNSKLTEYKAKFKPFSNYVYLPGNGWLKPKQLRPTSAASAPNTVDQVDAAKSTTVEHKPSESAVEDAMSESLPVSYQQWYEEVAERNKKANQYRSRSQFGNPILGKFF